MSVGSPCRPSVQGCVCPRKHTSMKCAGALRGLQVSRSIRNCPEGDAPLHLGEGPASRGPVSSVPMPMARSACDGRDGVYRLTRISGQW